MRNTHSPTGLPFVGRTSNKGPLSFWTVPPSRDYMEGTKVGGAMAAAYLAYAETNPNGPPILPQIIIDMQLAGATSEGLQGQLVGFLTALENRIVSKTTKMGG